MTGRNTLSGERGFRRDRRRPPQLPIIDAVGAALAAFSFHMKLNSSYSGSAFRVRRSSDNTEQDIGFVGYYVDIPSLLSFVGAGNGFVRTWYDQSGNTRDLAQSTTGKQPQIVSSGSLLTIGSGYPAASFDGSDDTLTRADALGLTGSPALTIAATAKIDLTDRGSAKTAWGLGSSGVTGSQRYALYMQGTTFSQDYGGAFNLFLPGITQDVHRIVERHASGANVDTMDARVDGVVQTRTGGSGTGALNMLNQTTVLGGSTVTSVTEYQIMQLSTWIAFNSSLSDANAVVLEARMLGLPG